MGGRRQRKPKCEPYYEPIDPNTIPIAWHHKKKRYQPFYCVDYFGLIVFSPYDPDEYLCDPYGACPVYKLIRYLANIDIDTLERVLDILEKSGVQIKDYRIVEDGEEWQETLREFTHYLNENYDIIEITTKDERMKNKKLLIVVRPDQIRRVYDSLNASALFYIPF